MGDDLLRKSKQLTAEIKSKHEEYLQSLDVPSDIGEKLHTLLQTKENLEADLMSLHLQKMILKELELPSEQMLNEGKIEKEIAESEEILLESKAAYEQNLSGMENTKQLMIKAMERLCVSLQELSQKITKLEDKFATIEEGWQESETFSNKDLNPSANKRAKEKILLLLENAKEEKDMMEKRLSRLESLQKLAENSAAYVQPDENSQSSLNRLQEKLSGLEFLSGMKCRILDDQTVAIHFVDPDIPRLPDDAKLVITLSFTSDESQCLELSAISTNVKIPEMEAVKENAVNYKDLPKLIRSLRKAWLSYVTLTVEISSLRERHAIDWTWDNRVFHLMIAKYICRLSIPPSYPCDDGQIKLEQIMGGQSNLTSVTEENPPKDVTLTGWVNHLATILA